MDRTYLGALKAYQLEKSLFYDFYKMLNLKEGETPDQKFKDDPHSWLCYSQRVSKIEGMERALGFIVSDEETSKDYDLSGLIANEELKINLFNLIKVEVICHLKEYSNNEDAMIHVKNWESISAKDLIKEIKNETLLGVAFMNSYIKSIHLLNENKRKK